MAKTIFVDFLEENGIDVEIVRTEQGIAIGYDVLYDADSGVRLSVFVEHLTPEAIQKVLDEIDIEDYIVDYYNYCNAQEKKECIEDVIEWRSDLRQFMAEYERITMPMPLKQETIYLAYETDQWLTHKSRVLRYVGTDFDDVVAQLSKEYDLDDNQYATLQEHRQLNANDYGLLIEEQRTNCFIE